MAENKTIYWILLVVAGFFLFSSMSSDEPQTKYDEVLPDASNCLDAGLHAQYTTIGEGDDVTPIEYCPLASFCDRFEVSTVLQSEEFDNAMLSNLEDKWDEFGTCFIEEARNTQRNFEGANELSQSLNSKFLCCENDVVCKPNDCEGLFTGMLDDSGCKVYGIELCQAETTCLSIGGTTVCDPQPFVNGCTWETKNEFGDTYFTEFNNCGLEIEQPCGTTSQYRCSEGPDVLCPIEYTLRTGKYIEGCGGH